MIYEVRWTPEATAAVGELGGPPPPPPGKPVFAAGESATYDVHWDGGPVDLPAGVATVSVLEGAAEQRWTFEARTDTASWLSRFLQAHDRFTTIAADASLLPLEHRREIREGRYELNRTFLYDRAARNIRVGESRAAASASDALTLPLGAADARDALTALYYVRTLALAPGTIVNVPINEAGSSLVLQVAAGEEETIDDRGRPTAAIRLEPRVMRRIERRRPLSMTLWLSADERRLPLRVIVDVDAGFGRVRAVLTAYRAP